MSKKIDFIANTVNGERWTKIGVAFKVKGDRIKVMLDAVPVNGEIILTPPKEAEELKDAGAE